MDAAKDFACYTCDHVGISGATKIHVHRIQSDRVGEEIYEARVGIAIMGHAAPTTTEDSDPFDRMFRDNFAQGYGTTKEKALAALKADMKWTADSLWA